MNHRERWARKMGGGAGAKAVETPKPAPYTPPLLARIWALELERGALWKHKADFWPCIEAVQSWVVDQRVTDPELLDAMGSLLQEPLQTLTTARRFLRTAQAYLQKERR